MTPLYHHQQQAGSGENDDEHQCYIDCDKNCQFSVKLKAYFHLIGRISEHRRDESLFRAFKRKIIKHLAKNDIFLQKTRNLVYNIPRNFICHYIVYTAIANTPQHPTNTRGGGRSLLICRLLVYNNRCGLTALSGVKCKLRRERDTLHVRLLRCPLQLPSQQFSRIRARAVRDHTSR